MPDLRAQASMHARQGQTPEALGARERARQDASQARPHAGGHDNPPADRRASVRHAQGMDGQHSLPDQDPRKGQNRDEPAGAGLQYEANDQYLRRQPADAGDRGLTARGCRRDLPLSRNMQPEPESSFHTTSVEAVRKPSEFLQTIAQSEIFRDFVASKRSEGSKKRTK